MHPSLTENHDRIHPHHAFLPGGCFQCSNPPQRGMAQRDGSLPPCRTDSSRWNERPWGHSHLPCRPGRLARLARLARQPDKLLWRRGLAPLLAGWAGEGGGPLSLNSGLLALTRPARSWLRCVPGPTDASIFGVSFTMVQRTPKSVHKWYGEEHFTYALVKLHVLGLT